MGRDLQRAAIKGRGFENSGLPPLDNLILTELDNVILDVNNRDSSQIQGFGQEDDPPSYADGARGDGTDSFLNLTNVSQSTFNFDASASFAVPGTPQRRVLFTRRSSSPVTTEEANAQEGGPSTQGGSRPKKARKREATEFWVEEEYKSLKVKQMTKNLDEQDLQMGLIRVQTQQAHVMIEELKERAIAEKAQAEFYTKARLQLDHQGVNLQILVPLEGDYNLQI